MILDIFRKKYTIRRHSEQQIVRGHAVYDYDELQTLLNVQPLNPDEIQALPEGERAELIDGQIYFMAPSSTNHQRILNYINTEINRYIRKNNGICCIMKKSR